MAQTRAFLYISGTDHQSFIQGLVTQDIDKLSPTQALYACLLTPQGKIVADFFLYAYQSGILLECADEICSELEKKLKFYKLRAAVNITNVSDRWARAAVADENSFVFDDPRHPQLPQRILCNNANEDKSQAALSLGAEESAIVTNQIRDTFGLDELTIATGTTTRDTSLVAGKRLSPKLSVRTGFNPFDQLWSFFLNYKITERWSVEAESGERQGADLLYSIERENLMDALLPFELPSP